MVPETVLQCQTPRQETTVPQLFHRRYFRLQLFALLAAAPVCLPGTATAQGAASTPASASQLTCPQANAMLVDQATGHPPDAAFLPQRRSRIG